MPIAAVDLERGILDFSRPKTGIPRKAILWPETVQAIREVIADRPTPTSPEHAGLLFVTKYGAPWGKATKDNPIAKEFAKLMRALGISGRKGRGFYTLRHVYRTIADETLDRPAIDLTMGHADHSMGGHYREHIAIERLQRVADYVHDWLFGPPPPATEPAPEPKHKREPKPPVEPDEVAQQAAAAWQTLYESAIPLGVSYEHITTENTRILGSLSARQLHAVAEIVGYSCWASAPIGEIVEGLRRRIAERVGSHQRNQFRAPAEGGAASRPRKRRRPPSPALPTKSPHSSTISTNFLASGEKPTSILHSGSGTNWQASRM